jgi:hypothetical protein
MCTPSLLTRCQVAQQLLAPCYTLLHSLQQQVNAGARWDAFGPAAEGQLVHLLTRARVLLEYSLQQLHHGQGTAVGRPLCRRRSVDIDPGIMESFLGSGVMGDSPPSGDHITAAAGASQRQAAAAAVLQEPALQLLLVELWPLVHMLCSAGASGRLLQVSSTQVVAAWHIMLGEPSAAHACMLHCLAPGRKSNIKSACTRHPLTGLVDGGILSGVAWPHTGCSFRTHAEAPVIV